MSETLAAALIGGVFTIVGSIAAVYVQRYFEARRPHRPGPPPPDPALPPGGGRARPAPAGCNAKAIAATAAGVFGLVAGAPMLGALCAGSRSGLGGAASPRPPAAVRAAGGLRGPAWRSAR
jgi:hypothetical protein